MGGQCWIGRGGREAECTGLENRQGSYGSSWVQIPPPPPGLLMNCLKTSAKAGGLARRCDLRMAPNKPRPRQFDCFSGNQDRPATIVAQNKSAKLCQKARDAEEARHARRNPGRAWRSSSLETAASRRVAPKQQSRRFLSCRERTVRSPSATWSGPAFSHPQSRIDQRGKPPGKRIAGILAPPVSVPS